MAECRFTIPAVADLQRQLGAARDEVQRLTDERDQWRHAATKLDRARVKEYEEALGQRDSAIGVLNEVTRQRDAAQEDALRLRQQLAQLRASDPIPALLYLALAWDEGEPERLGAEAVDLGTLRRCGAILVELATQGSAAGSQGGDQ